VDYRLRLKLSAQSDAVGRLMIDPKLVPEVAMAFALLKPEVGKNAAVQVILLTIWEGMGGILFSSHSVLKEGCYVDC
jgi:hypothetical protein